MRSRIFAVLPGVLAIALGAGCSRDFDLPADPGSPDGGAVTGRLVLEDAVGGRIPVPGGVVELLRRADRTVATADGLFVIQPPPDVAWQALFRGECDEANICQRQRLISSNELPLQPGVDLSIGDVLLSANGEARGSVVLADGGLPISIAVYVPGSPFKTQTDSEGNFVLRYLPEGTMTVAAFLPGYEPQAIAGVKISAGTATSLAPIELGASDGTRVGSVEGTVVCDEPASCTGKRAKIQALRGAELAVQAETEEDLGASFVLADLPFGFYTLTFEVEGYGRAVVENVLIADPPVGDENVRLGNVIVGEGFQDPTPGETPTCDRPADERGPCVVRWEPPSTRVLPSFAVVKLWIDERLQDGTAAVVFVSTAGDVVPGEVISEEPEGEKLVITARPVTPLEPGFWTASLAGGVRDAEGKAPPAGGASWIVTGLGVTPGIVGRGVPTLEANSESLRPSATFIEGALLIAFREVVDGSEVLSRTRLAAGNPSAVDHVASQAELAAGPGPRLITIAGKPRVLTHKQCDQGDGVPFATVFGDFSGDIFNVIDNRTFGCGDITTMTAEPPMVMAAGRKAAREIIVATSADGSSAETRTNAVQFTPVQIELGNAGSSTFLASVDDAGQLRVHTVAANTLTQAPATNVGSVVMAAVCESRGRPVVVYAGSASAGASLLADGAWKTDEPLLEGPAESVACRTLGETPIAVVESGDRLFAYFLDARTDLEGAEVRTWARWDNPAEADGALNSADCKPDPEISIAPDPDGGALVVWSALCEDGLRYVQGARVR